MIVAKHVTWFIPELILVDNAVDYEVRKNKHHFINAKTFYLNTLIKSMHSFVMT